MRASMRRAFLGGSFTGVGGQYNEVSHGPGIVLGDSTAARNPTVASYLRNPLQVDITDLSIPGYSTPGQMGLFNALPSGTKTAARWVIIMTGMNDRYGSSNNSATMITNYQDAINTIRAACPTAKIIAARINPAFSFFDALLGLEGPTAVANYKAEWHAFNDAIAGLGPTPITGVDFRCVRQTDYLVDPNYPFSLHPLLAENPGDLHQNPTGSQIIARAWQNALDSVFAGVHVPLLPSVPTSLVGVASSNSIAYTWAASVVDSAHDAAVTYQLQVSLDGTTYSNAGSPVAGTSASAVGLVPSTPYYARVFATNVAGNSGFSSVDTRSTTAAGSTALSRMAAKGWGINQPAANYFTGCYPYRNFIRLSVPTWDSNAGTTDADGWITGLPAGGSASVRVVFGATYLPPGNYVVHTGGGAFCTITDLSYSITNVVQGNNGARDCTFTVPNYPIGDLRYFDLYLSVTVTNGTGSPVNVNDLFLGLASNLAGHSISTSATAAQIFDPAFLADLAGCGAMKYADWQLANSQDTDYSVVPADLAKESTRSWATLGFYPGPGGGKGIPHGVAAKLCAYVGMALWICMPPVHTWYNFTAAAGTDVLTAQASFPVWATGQRVVAYGTLAAPLVERTLYYVIRVDATHFKLATTLSNANAGIAIDLTTDFSFTVYGIHDPGPVWDAIVDDIYAAAPGVDLCPQFVLEPWNFAFFWNQIRGDLGWWPYLLGEIPEYVASQTLGWRMTRIWQAFERRFPRSQIIRLIENQGTAFDYTVPDTYDYVDTIGRAGVAGAPLRDIVDVSSSAYYPHFYGDDAPADGSGTGWQFQPRDLVAQGAIGWTDAQWSQSIRRGIDRYRMWVKRDRAVLDFRVRRHIPMITYEGGLTEGLFGYFDQFLQGFQTFTVDVPGSKILFTNTGGPGGAQQYDGYPITFHGNGALPAPLAYETQYFCKNPDAAGMQLSATPGGSVITLGGALSGSTNYFGNAGQAAIDLGARHYLYTQSAQAGLDQEYYLSVLRDVGFIHYTHYTATSGVGYSKRSTGQFQWKGSQYVADPPVVTASKAYHFTPPSAPNPGSWVDDFNRTWTTAASGGAFTWSVESGAPQTSSGKLGGASFRVYGNYGTTQNYTLGFDITINSVGGIYPEVRIGGVDANNHFGVLFANTQPTLFMKKSGVNISLGQFQANIPDNATTVGCELQVSTTPLGRIDLEFRVAGRICAYAYNIDPLGVNRGSRFWLCPESTILFDNFKVYT